MANKLEQFLTRGMSESEIATWQSEQKDRLEKFDQEMVECRNAGIARFLEFTSYAPQQFLDQITEHEKETMYMWDSEDWNIFFGKELSSSERRLEYKRTLMCTSPGNDWDRFEDMEREHYSHVEEYVHNAFSSSAKSRSYLLQVA